MVAAGMAGVVLAGVSACAGDPANAPSASTTTTPPGASVDWKLPAGQRIVFRNTAAGDDFGRVASVSASSPHGKRTMTGLSCERVYATRDAVSCMSLNSTSPIGYRETLYDGRGGELRFWPLPGAPSRTRLSADSKVAAWTAFVDGESYANIALPVFVAVKVYSTMSPTAAGSETPEEFAVLVRVRSGPCTNGTSAPVGGVVTGGPVGGLPAAVAEFWTRPLSMSACVSAYVAVAVTVWPARSTPGLAGAGQL
jgi:hypothetical protein